MTTPATGSQGNPTTEAPVTSNPVTSTDKPGDDTQSSGGKWILPTVLSAVAVVVAAVVVTVLIVRKKKK